MDWLGGLATGAALAPGVIGFGLARAARLGASGSRIATATGAAAAFVLAVGSAWALAWHGPSSAVLVHLPGPGSQPLALGVYVDGLTVLMLLTVTLIGAVVTRYAVRSLDGDPGQARFSQWIAFTSSAVLLLVVSDNLLVFFAAWLATSHGLHRLLTYYADRPAAMLAARSKLLVTRLGDAFLLAAVVLVYHAFGSLRLSEVLPRAGELEVGGPEAFGIASLLVLAAMAKSAQLPFHAWLPDSMETPTPVSALMHAGIINAGGFLLIRLSPVLVASPAALGGLALGGAATALFGSVVLSSQTDVKRKYAWSTVSQMGFMMLQCGLGAFAAAALHLVGHAFYKGHAFLAAGSAVDPEGPAVRRKVAAEPVGPRGIAGAVVGGVGIVVLVMLLLGIAPAGKPGLFVLGSILALALAQLLLTVHALVPRSPRWILGSALAGAAVAIAYFAGVAGLERVLGPALPTFVRAPGALEVALVGLFVVALLLQTWIAAGARSPFAASLYVHASNGFYLGALQNRIVQRVWPADGRSQHAR
jgi:NAD(P)H-quinone oxidoreductase subunit 5